MHDPSKRESAENFVSEYLEFRELAWALNNDDEANMGAVIDAAETVELYLAWRQHYATKEELIRRLSTSPDDLENA